MKQRVFLLVVSVLGLCAPLSAQVTDLYSGIPVAGSANAGQSMFYRFEMATFGNLVLTLQSDHGWSQHSLYLQRDVLPSTEEHLAGSTSGGPEQVIEIAQLEPGTYYVMVQGVDTFFSPGYSLLAQSAEQLLSLVLGEAITDSVSEARSAFYRLEIDVSTHLVLTLQDHHAWSQHFLYFQRDVMPSTEDHLAASTWAGSEQIIEIAQLEPGIYYVMVRGVDTFFSPAYSILAQSAEQLPPLVFDEPLAGSVSAGQSRFYRLEMPGEGHLLLTLENDHGWSSHALYLQRDVLPTTEYYLDSSESDAPSQIIEIPDLQPGPYYVMVRGVDTFFSAGFSIQVTDLDHPPGEPESTLWVSTYKGGAGGQVTVRVWAVGLAEDAQVLLLGDDGTTIEAEVTPELEGYLAGRFVLTGAALGEYDLVAINPDGREFAAPQPFTIEAEVRVELWVDIVGRDSIRAGREQPYWIRCGNSGNIDAHGVIIWIEGIPADADWRLGVELEEPFFWPDDAPIGPDEIPLGLEVDGRIAIPLMVSGIAPGSSVTIPLVVQPHAVGEFDLEVWVGEPLYGSQMKLKDVDCVAKVIEVAADAVLGAVLGECAGFVKDVATDSFRMMSEAVSQQHPNESPMNRVFGFGQIMGGWLVSGAKCLIDLGVSAAAPWAKAALVAVKLYGNTMKAIAIVEECRHRSSPHPAQAKHVRVVQAIDPNEKAGPAGFGAGGFIPVGEEMMYVIYFENVESATAPAQEVVITDQLDLATLDGESLGLGQIAFSDTVIDVPPRLKTYTATIELGPDQNLTLRVEAELDQSSGQLTWTFTSLDPETGELTEDPLAGFLPPNVTPPEGEGYVMFTVRHKSDLPSGTEIRNKASIVFDVNPPIETGEVLNTIDAGTPSSEVWSLEDVETDTEFDVSWGGEDDSGGSGVRDYTIYVSTDDEPYEVWVANTTETSATFSGEHGHSYKFYSRAIDNVGHMEAAPDVSDATTTVAATTVPWYSLTVSVISGEGTCSPSEGTFVEETTVPLTCAPAEGYQFGSWNGVDAAEGNTATVTMNSDRMVTVEFAEVEQVMHSLTVSVTEGEGTVTPSGGTFEKGTDVPLTVMPAEGYQFGSWSGVDSTDGDTAMVTMNSDRTVTVTFTAAELSPGQGIPPALPSGAMCGACGSGASAGMIMSLCVLGFARFRRGRKGRTGCHNPSSCQYAMVQSGSEEERSATR